MKTDNPTDNPGESSSNPLPTPSNSRHQGQASSHSTNPVLILLHSSITDNDETTRAISASEAIYSRPIGPELPPEMSAHGDNNERRNDVDNLPDSGFTQQQMATLTSLFDRFDRRQQRSRSRSPRRRSPRHQSPPAPADVLAARAPQFRARDVGFFDPDPKLPPVEPVKDHNIYHNVFSFTNRLRVKSTTMDVALLRQNLDACLLGAADTWYNTELNHPTR